MLLGFPAYKFRGSLLLIKTFWFFSNPGLWRPNLDLHMQSRAHICFELGIGCDHITLRKAVVQNLHVLCDQLLSQCGDGALDMRFLFPVPFSVAC